MEQVYKKRVILVGKAASGKDYARKGLQEKGLSYGISYTTRPPREGEVDGKDYHFITEEKFSQMIDSDQWYEYVIFKDWFYGTSKEQINGDFNLFIMTPKGLSQLSDTDRKESLIIYFDISEDIRRDRLKERSDNNDSIERRIEADRKDFEGFFDHDLSYGYHKYSIEDIVQDIKLFTNIKID